MQMYSLKSLKVKNVKTEFEEKLIHVEIQDIKVKLHK